MLGFGFVVDLPLIGTPPAQPSPGGRGGRFVCFSKPEFNAVSHVGVLLPNTSVSPLSLWECMYRRHGGHMFGDMVDGFRSSYLP